MQKIPEQLGKTFSLTKLFKLNENKKEMSRKRFLFRLETVLKLRKARETRALAELADARRAVSVAIEAKNMLQSSLNEATSARSGKILEGLTGAELATYGLFDSGMKQRLIQIDQAILRANRNCQKKVELYLVAHKKTRALEILKERDFSEYKKAKQQKEFRDLDDLSVMRARFRSEDAA